MASANVPSSSASASTAAIPYKRDADVGERSLSGGAAGTLVISLLAIAAVLYLRKRLNLGGASTALPGRRIRVLESQRLGPRSVLTVIDYSGRELLIAQTEHGVTVLCDSQGERS
jgi:flagellar biogenesis protein FliO